MKKYSTNYSNNSNNFVIQNLNGDRINNEFSSAISIVKNELLNNKPAHLSSFLQEKIGKNGEQNLETPTSLFELENPTNKASAIIRFQLLILELLEIGKIDFINKWSFEVLAHDFFDNISYRDEFYGVVEEVDGNYLELAIEDLLISLNNIFCLDKINCKIPETFVKKCATLTDFSPNNEIVKIDFSLLQGYNKKNLHYPDVIFVRTDDFEE